MADFDSDHGDDAEAGVLHGDGQYPGVDCITFLEQNFQNVVNELNYLRNVVARPSPPPPVLISIFLSQPPSQACQAGYKHLNSNYFSTSLATRTHILTQNRNYS